MTDLVIASTEADVAAATAVEEHHAELAGRLAVHVESLVAATARTDSVAAEAARERLVRWCEQDLLPHASAEESVIYPAARQIAEGRLLVEAMLGEHAAITALVRALTTATDAVRAAGHARAVQAVLDIHVAKENRQLLPLLTAAPGVSLAELLGGMHEVLGGEASAAGATATGCGGHSCSCGEEDGPGLPELDARTIPHAIRHATIFGALDAVGPGRGLVLLASHDPLPLLAQVEQRSPGLLEVDYLERGPDTWRLTFIRRAEAV